MLTFQLELEREALLKKLSLSAEEFREKLQKYIADVSDASNAAAAAAQGDANILGDMRAVWAMGVASVADICQAVDAMFNELVSTYASRERQQFGSDFTLP